MSSVSIVISAKNEALNLPFLTDEVAGVCEPILDYEIVIVDDGSDDHTVQLVKELMEQKFGDATRPYQDRLAAASSEELHSWSQRILSAETLDEVFAENLG